MTVTRRVSAVVLLSVLLLAAVPATFAQEGGAPPDDGGGGGGGDTPPDSGNDGEGSDNSAGDSSAPPGSGSASSTSSTSLTAECDQEGADAHYAETLIGSGDTMIRQVASDTGCANHVNYGAQTERGFHFPGRLFPTNTSVPAYPMLRATEASTDLSETRGDIGILSNGVALYSAWARGVAESYETSAVFLEAETLDGCGAHSTEQGWYHYHSTPGCLQEQVTVLQGLTLSDHSPRLGWSYDGFPVYGQLGVNGVEMTLCGEDISDVTYCLDSCGGYTGELPDVDGFAYRYYLTCGYTDAFFPSTVNCYRGCCPIGMTCGQNVEPCTEDASAGTTADYVPEAEAGVTDVYDTDMLEGSDLQYIESDLLYDCGLLLGSVNTNLSSVTNNETVVGTASPTLTTSAPTVGATVAPSIAPTGPGSEAPINTGTPAPTVAGSSGATPGGSSTPDEADAPATEAPAPGSALSPEDSDAAAGPLSSCGSTTIIFVAFMVTVVVTSTEWAL